MILISVDLSCGLVILFFNFIILYNGYEFLDLDSNLIATIGCWCWINICCACFEINFLLRQEASTVSSFVNL